MTWENTQVTAAVQYLRPRVWRSRVPATAKQIAYGAELTDYVNVFTDGTVDLDFAAMSCQQATDELTRLEEMIAAFTALDTISPADAMTGAKPNPEHDITEMFAAMDKGVLPTHEAQNEN